MVKSLPFLLIENNDCLFSVLLIIHGYISYHSSSSKNRTGGVMVSVLASSVVDRGFDPRSGQTKDYEIGICCFSAKHPTLRRKSKDFFGSESE